MTTIMMPQQIDSAIKEMCSDAMTQAVATLADKYGFDADEANRFLASDSLTIVRKRGPAKTSQDSPAKAKVAAADKPKRGKTGYLLYADEVRAEVRAELEADLDDGDKLKPQDVVKEIAVRWGAEDQSVKDEWKSKAKTPVTSDDEEPKTPPKTSPKSSPKKESKKESKKVVEVESDDDIHLEADAEADAEDEADADADAKADADADADDEEMAEVVPVVETKKDKKKNKKK
jgi:transposase-like protein